MTSDEGETGREPPHRVKQAPLLAPLTTRRTLEPCGRTGPAWSWAKTSKVLQAKVPQYRQIAALLEPEMPVEGVAILQVRPDLKGLGELAVKEGSTGVPLVAFR